MRFFFKKKVSLEECTAAILHFISEMQCIIHNEFDEVLYINYGGEAEIDESEKSRRDWELMFFILSLIQIWIINNLKEKDRENIVKNLFKGTVEICSGEKFEKLCSSDSSDIFEFTKAIGERINAYKYALNYEQPGPDLYNLAKCFLSVIWFEIPDPNNPIMFVGNSEALYVANISIKIIEFIKGFFEKFKIV
jgi:hypothetical protein